jgi:uncharacterized damage-inducible protein DinB
VTGDRKVLEVALRHALSGAGAHVETHSIFAGLDWKLAGARPEHVQHSVYQLLNHMLYWQEWVVTWCDGRNPPIPKHASASWPGDAAPGDRHEWDDAVRAFRNGLKVLARRSRDRSLLSKSGTKSTLEMLHTIASHNSYHAGQVVVMRQMLGAWPPASGGLTW